MGIQPPIINIFEKAVRKAGKILIRDFKEVENLQIQSKSLGNFVTSADLKSEKIIIETLQYYFPDYTYRSEERPDISGDKDHVIIIDPIDGTTNFIHGIPVFGIVVAKLFKNEIQDGVIFNPITNDFFWSSKGQGAWCNNTRLRVSKRENIEDSIIGFDILHSKQMYKNYLKEIDQIAKQYTGLRSMGSASINLAYTAAGKLDAYWGRNLNLWDVSSGILLVTEAGGKISRPSGENWDIDSSDILASNGYIHQKMIQNLLIK